MKNFEVEEDSNCRNLKLEKFKIKKFEIEEICGWRSLKLKKLEVEVGAFPVWAL